MECAIKALLPAARRATKSGMDLARCLAGCAAIAVLSAPGCVGGQTGDSGAAGDHVRCTPPDSTLSVEQARVQGFLTEDVLALVSADGGVTSLEIVLSAPAAFWTARGLPVPANGATATLLLRATDRVRVPASIHGEGAFALANCPRFIQVDLGGTVEIPSVDGAFAGNGSVFPEDPVTGSFDVGDLGRCTLRLGMPSTLDCLP